MNEKNNSQGEINVPEQVISRRRITIPSSRLQPARIAHAALILVLPILGSCYAFNRLISDGFKVANIAAFGLMYVISWVGITVGYHRHFTHLSFQTFEPVRFLLGIFGSMACQGPLKYWVSNHRRHHRFTDVEGDVHSPHFKGEKKLIGWRKFWHSHVGWTFTHEISNTVIFTPDLIRDPVARFVNNNYYSWVALGFIIPSILGGFVDRSWDGALMGFIWGGMVRLLVTYHSVNAVTSFAHLWGAQAYKTRDRSTNNIWLCIPTWGESWHNNHHADPGSAYFGFRWWQLDIGGGVIFAMKIFKLAWKVRSRRIEKFNENT